MSSIIFQLWTSKDYWFFKISMHPFRIVISKWRVKIGNSYQCDKSHKNIKLRARQSRNPGHTMWDQVLRRRHHRPATHTASPLYWSEKRVIRSQNQYAMNGLTIGKLTIPLHDKQDFPIPNFPYLCTNIPLSPTHSLYVCQLNQGRLLEVNVTGVSTVQHFANSIVIDLFYSK